ncbi:hypothetical protein LAZ67_9000139 [Cordylochernes scorpioides]|uniref:Uncharacterized protein n=1 Tax=Cordylochernes scorpioides TaxID=51811 RepID=A0ABY6KVM8_9ARAC|nr:hypothetical protein LAZ67_9000139 [Cordylochernes scorpioides]
MYNIIPSDLNNHVNPYPNIIESRKLAIQRTNDRHDKEKIKYDNKHKNPHFDTGDLVLVKAYHHPNSGKLVPYFTGPYKITEIISDNVVRINRPNRITGLLGHHSLHVIPPTKPSSPGAHSVVYSINLYKNMYHLVEMDVTNKQRGKGRPDGDNDQRRQKVA